MAYLLSILGLKGAYALGFFAAATICSILNNNNRPIENREIREYLKHNK